MAMQQTDSTKIESEKQLVKKVAGLSDTDEVSFNDRGWDSRVYSFGDGCYFFKFPRSEKVQNLYEYEIAAIKYISNLDVKIVAQKILWEHPENAYFGYEGVRGQSINNVLENLGVSQKMAIGEVLGDFLKHFHELKLPGARTMSLDDETKQIQRWYEKSIPVVRERFSQKEQEKLKQLIYVGWPTKLIELGSDPVLSHGDLHFENVLYSKDGSVGVIDFGDVAYYDRSKDFLELAEDQDIYRAVVKEYGYFDTVLSEKIKVRQAMIQVINLGFHAGKEDEKNIKKTAEKIRQSL